MYSAFDQFSAHLRAQAPDTQDWSDEGGWQVAANLLLRFTAEDWEELVRTWRLNDSSWRTCLADILTPQNASASNLLLEMTSDQDTDVSFTALCRVAFYCGVNVNAEGPFVDQRICVPAFLQVARDHPLLLRNLEHTRRHCADFFDRQFGLLAARLSRNDP